MQVQDINQDGQATKIFTVTDSENENPLKWTIEPTKLEIIPEEEGHYIVIAKQVYADKTVDCFLNIMTPERISEMVLKIKNGMVSAESKYDQESSVIPAIASDCFGVYELYYATENPQIGIDILNNGLQKSIKKTVIAEDLGYILRDENRPEEAIEAFLISEQLTPSSEYIYAELAQLYEKIGQKEKQAEYEEKFKANE
jgi:tetratricopeptide (TPR) repeat protein